MHRDLAYGPLVAFGTSGWSEADRAVILSVADAEARRSGVQAGS